MLVRNSRVQHVVCEFGPGDWGCWCFGPEEFATRTAPPDITPPASIAEARKDSAALFI